MFAGCVPLAVLTALLAQDPTPRAPTLRELDLAQHFDRRDGCFVLLDVGRNELARFRPERCREPLSPCSTFKIPNSLIGLECGAVQDADTLIQWDGVSRSRPALNRDHTLRSALADSVVWYHQEVARRVGAQRMQAALDAIPYGNRDISGGLTEFWLGSSLKISADEQVEFLRRLAAGKLPFAKRTQDIVRDILVIERTPGYVLRGKTGTEGRDQQNIMGWFVGYLTRGEQVYVFAANLKGPGVMGRDVQKITMAILRERKLLDP